MESGRRSRSVTRAEALVVQELLSGGADGSLTRSIPRRTRQTARQRLYLRAWVRDRYVPDFGELGRPILTFAVATPYSERLWPTAQRWRALPEAMLLWAGSSILFGLFASPAAPGRPAVHDLLHDPDAHPVEYLMDVDARQPSVPVFFDFEGIWAKAACLPAPVAYPQPLPRSARLAGREDSEVPLPPAEHAAALRLLGRPFLPSSRGEESAGLFAGMAERRCLRNRTITLRTLLDPGAVARWIPDFPQQCVLVHAALREGARPPDLFHALVNDCSVHPFLFATNGGDILVGALGAPRSVDERSGPSRPALVASVLQRFLVSIVVHREPLDALEVVTDHRYDRPFDYDRDHPSSVAVKTSADRTELPVADPFHHPEQRAIADPPDQQLLGEPSPGRGMRGGELHAGGGRPLPTRR